MNKKFINLPSKYTKFLNDCMNQLNPIDIKRILKKEMNLKDINIIYKKINVILKNNDCTNYDINKMIKSYNKKNNKILLLKKISDNRNKIIISESKGTKVWNNNINNLKKKSNLLGIKTTNKLIEKSFLNLLNKYKYEWNTISKIFNIGNNGVIKNINIFDVDDIEYIISK